MRATPLRFQVPALFILLALSAFAISPTACAQETFPPRPVLIIFDFESSWDSGRFGHKIAEMFYGHADRRGRFILLDPVSFSEILEASHVKVEMNSEPVEVSALAEEQFAADVAIWGKLERIGKDNYKLHVRAVDRAKDPAALALDKVYSSTQHGVQLSVEAALNDLLGPSVTPESDIYADTSWRTRKNLCVNGNFERGDITPTGWEPMDGLAIFWVSGASPTGRCVMMDTDVPEPQYKEWRRRFEAGAPASQAPKKMPTRPPYYDTIGGLVGAHIYSDPIPIQQGATYRIDLDCRAPASNAICFVKGYASFIGWDGKPQPREVYRAQLNLKTKTNGEEWEHFAMVFHPTQPLHLLPIQSDFDDGKTGEQLRNLLLQRLVALNAVETTSAERIVEKVKGNEHLLRLDSPREQTARVVRQNLGRGVAVWGGVSREGDKLSIGLRGMDIRAVAITKRWRRSWETRPGRLEETAGEIANAILENTRVVTHLRIKLDCYWPPDNYYFDNVALTEQY